MHCLKVKLNSQTIRELQESHQKTIKTNGRKTKKKGNENYKQNHNFNISPLQLHVQNKTQQKQTNKGFFFFSLK